MKIAGRLLPEATKQQAPMLSSGANLKIWPSGGNGQRWRTPSAQELKRTNPPLKEMRLPLKEGVSKVLTPVKFCRVCAHFSFRRAGMKPVPRSVNLALAGLFKHPLNSDLMNPDSTRSADSDNLSTSSLLPKRSSHAGMLGCPLSTCTALRAVSR